MRTHGLVSSAYRVPVRALDRQWNRPDTVKHRSALLEQPKSPDEAMARTSPTNQFLTPGDGRKIAYKVYKPSTTTSGGSDRPTRPLVMIQGMSAVGTVDYDDLACELSKHGRTVVTLDNRDIGESTWTPAPSSSSSAAAKSFTLQDMAGDVIDLIRHLGYSEVDVLGHSMGGMLETWFFSAKDGRSHMIILSRLAELCCLARDDRPNPHHDTQAAVQSQALRPRSDVSAGTPVGSRKSAVRTDEEARRECGD